MNALPPRHVWDVYLSGYCAGYRAGLHLGRREMEEELSTLQREAHRVVMAMSKLDPHDVAQQRRRAAQVAAAEGHAANAQPWPPEVSR